MAGTAASRDALARRWAEAINKRDLDGLLPLAHEEIELYPLQFGVSGHYTGHDGLAQWMRELTTNDLGHTARIDRLRELEDGRVALFGTVCADGQPLSAYALLVGIRDGKVAVMRSYLSDERTLELLGVL